jgi:hypothetical protein
VKRQRLQCKDIPATAVLNWMRSTGRAVDAEDLREVCPLFLVPLNVARAKLEQLRRKGHVEPDPPGARSFLITPGGVAWLTAALADRAGGDAQAVR